MPMQSASPISGWGNEWVSKSLIYMQAARVTTRETETNIVHEWELARNSRLNYLAPTRNLSNTPYKSEEANLSPILH